jgi:hypothetical protein
MKVITAQDFILALGQYFNDAQQENVIILLPEGQILQLGRAQTTDLSPDVKAEINILKQTMPGVLSPNYSLLGNDDPFSLTENALLDEAGFNYYGSLLQSNDDLT